MADVENILNDDDFFGDIADTPKEGIVQHKNRESLKSIIGSVKAYFPLGVRCHRDVSFRSHIGRDVVDHAKTLWRRCNWYVIERDLFETSLRRLTGT